MRRSICQCEPNYALAGQVSTWKFSYTTSTSLPKGTRLKFDLLSKGSAIDWQTPEVNIKEKVNVVWAELPGNKTITATYSQDDVTLSDCFEFLLTSDIKAGETISIFLGTPDKSKENGNRCQTYVQRRKPFHLYIDPKGKGDFRDPEIFTMDIRGNHLHVIKIVAPSLVGKNKRFDVIVRFEDEFGNLTSLAPEGTLIELSYENLRENLNWKLFVPETGFINLPNLYFNEVGLYKIQLLNANTGEKFYSSPIRCFADQDLGIYWGLFHGESEKFDSGENVEACLRYFRDEKALNFFASSNFESAEETSNDEWKLISQHTAEFNEEHRFTTFLGVQWFGDTPEEGLKQLIFTKDNKPILRKKDAKSNNLKKIYKTYSSKELFAICNFTMGKGLHTNFDDFTPEFEKLVEIYNAWGSSECKADEGNPRPICIDGDTGVKETDIGSVRNALEKNCRFGFVAGGLDDRGVYNDFFESDQVQYSPGLTAILATDHTREALVQALSSRSCYATTGEKIVVGFAIAGAKMGSELSTKAKPGLTFNRHITGYVSGTAPIKEISIIRNGTVFQTFHPKEASFDFTFDDSEHLAKVCFPAKWEKLPFVYYYIRVIQEDEHIAWSSPIWIDYYANDATNSAKKARKKAG